MNDLGKKHCEPCEEGTLPLSAGEIGRRRKQLTLSWEVIEQKKLRRRFTFKNFREALVFVNRVAGVAEEEGHHPDINIVYNKVTLILTTHAIGGLSENDFILAAKIEKISKP